MEWGKAPDVCFAEAHRVGEGVALELQALERAAAHLDVVRAMSRSMSHRWRSSTQAAARCCGCSPRSASCCSYPNTTRSTTTTLSPMSSARCARGLRLAIDDVGAGFSSLRHIVLTAPDVITLDRSVVTGVAADPVLRRLIASMVAFPHGGDAGVVAEGVETEDDAAALRDLGVDDGQGWLFGRPGSAEALDEPAGAPASSMV
ncbi:MAG: EAL domain-containing protein [Kineosporiaceae bacterium]